MGGDVATAEPVRAVYPPEVRRPWRSQHSQRTHHSAAQHEESVSEANVWAAEAPQAEIAAGHEASWEILDSARCDLTVSEAVVSSKDKPCSAKVLPPWLQTARKLRRMHTTSPPVQSVEKLQEERKAALDQKHAETEFDGKWCAASISDGTLSWNEGEDVTIRVLSCKKFSMTYVGKVHCAELRDGKLYWNDGDVWAREGDRREASAASSSSSAQVETTASVCRQPTETTSSASTAQSTAMPKRGRTVIVSAPVSSTQYRGTIKWFRGTYGWVECGEVAKMHPDCDIFLHVNDCNFKRPRQWDRVLFELSTDDKGDPKAVNVHLR